MRQLLTTCTFSMNGISVQRCTGRKNPAIRQAQNKILQKNTAAFYLHCFIYKRGGRRELNMKKWSAIKNVNLFNIHGSVHRNSMLIRSNKMQQYTIIYSLQNHLILSGVHRTHHQVNIKLWLQPLVQVIVTTQQQPSSNVANWPRWRKVVSQTL